MWYVLVGGIPTPLKNDGVRQLGWWHSQPNGKIKNVPNHQPVYNYICLCLCSLVASPRYLTSPKFKIKQKQYVAQIIPKTAVLWFWPPNCPESIFVLNSNHIPWDLRIFRTSWRIIVWLRSHHSLAPTTKRWRPVTSDNSVDLWLPTQWTN